MAEQRYQAVLAVITEGRTVTEVAGQWKVSRQTLHAWLRRYELEGLGGLADRSHRPASCPHQMPATVEAAVLEMRRAHPFWGPYRIVVELGRNQVVPLPSESAVYRCLVRAGVMDPVRRRRRPEDWKRWERGRPMELWQMDVVGGFLIADGTSAKALTGLDNHSRFCVSARLMVSSQSSCTAPPHGTPLQEREPPDPAGQRDAAAVGQAVHVTEQLRRDSIGIAHLRDGG